MKPDLPTGWPRSLLLLAAGMVLALSAYSLYVANPSLLRVALILDCVALVGMGVVLRWDAYQAAASNRRLAAFKERQQHLLSSSPAVIYATAVTAHYPTTFVSENISRMMGYRPSDALSKPHFWLEHLHPDDRQRSIEEFNHIYNRQEVVLEYRVKNVAGEYIWIQDTARLLRDSAGRPLEVIGSWSDISSRKKTELELEQARDDALRATRVKSGFLANMSHEIRTPMNGVLGMLELLGNSALEPPQQRYVHIAQRSAKSLLGIINDILDVSRIESGKLEVECIEFSICELVEDISRVFAEQAAQKGLHLSCSIDYDIQHSVRTDPTRVRQVLTNLLANAIKFTEAGEVALRLEKTYEDAAVMGLRLEVEDNGIGIAKEAQERLFSPFTQADNSITRRYGGTGLGLAISKQLVELLGGEIGLQSKPGRGSRFWFTLDVAKGNRDQAADGSARALTGARILAASACAHGRAALAELFKYWQIPLECVASGPALVAAGQSGPRPDIVILDSPVAEIGGVELLEQIDAVPALADVKWLLIGSVSDLSLGFLADRPVDAIVSKPLRRHELLRTLIALVSEAPGGDVEQPARTKARFRGRVLVVEDNPINQTVAANLLASYGLDVVLANNGQEGLDSVVAEQFDLVFMDCQMPVLDGLSATQAIRARERLGDSRRTPVVAMTANAMAGDRERCLAAGMDGYLSKPVNRDALQGVLARWLAQVDEPAVPARPMLGATDSNADGGEIVNHDIVEQLRETMGEDFEGLLEAYLNVSFAQLQELRDGLADGDFERIRIAAHTLKSSSANMGALGVAGLAKQLEHTASEAERGELEKLLDLLARELGRVRGFFITKPGNQSGQAIAAAGAD